jgi:hypothetical protein
MPVAFGHVGTAMDGQPVRQRQQSLSGTTKALHFTVLRRRHTTDAGDDDVLMYVQPGTARIEYLHAALLQDREWQRRQPSLSDSGKRAPAGRHHVPSVTIRGARRVAGQTLKRAQCTR